MWTIKYCGKGKVSKDADAVDRAFGGVEEIEQCDISSEDE